MNFKAVYKRANDNIHGDKRIIDAIYEKRQKKHINMRYISLCAACVLLVVSISAFPAMYDSGDKNSGTLNQVTYNDKITKSLPGGGVLQRDSSFDSNDVNKTEDMYSGIKQRETMDDDKHTHEELRQETADNYADNEVPAGEQAKGYMNVPSTKSVSAANSIMNNDFETVTVTLQEYAMYLRADSTFVLPQIPAGMKVEFPKFAVLTYGRDGAIADDSLELVALDGDDPSRILSLSASLLHFKESVPQDAAREVIGGLNADVYSSGNIKKVFLKHDNIFVTVSAVNVSNEEFNVFLNTLINNNK